ncbi:MAG: peptidoglycan DD-metalloendopeptidase family protein [Lysobacterales bacterium]
MNAFRGHWMVLPLALLLAGCGAAPRVRVTPTPGLPTQSEALAIAGGGPEAQRSVDGGSATHRVVAGETLYSIAFRQGRDYRELAAINGIREPFTIYPGQVLHLQPAAAPPPPDKPPVSTLPTSPLASAASPTAATGTFALAEPERPLTAQALPESPGAVQEVQLSEQGRLIQEPAASPTTETASAQAAPKPGVSGTTEIPAPAPVPKPAVVVAPPIDDQAATRKVEGILWRWPAGGKLIGRFLAGDPTQQGIDLAGQVGAPVLAAADGEVVYSGNGLLGYGELLIVQHSPDFLSAYGHNQRRLVQEGERVRAGQTIAEQGQRGSISLLHFEVRRRGKPVDPLSYLPPR